MPEPCYVCVDCETAGPIPGDYALMSIGACVVGEPESAFYAEPSREDGNGLRRDWSTDAWLDENRSFGAPQAPYDVAALYAHWLRSLPGEPVFVGYPAVFDWQFSHWLLEHYLGPRSDPFGFGRALDLKTLASAVLRCPVSEVGRRRLREAGFRPERARARGALDDAREQAELAEWLLGPGMAGP